VLSRDTRQHHDTNRIVLSVLAVSRSFRPLFLPPCGRDGWTGNQVSDMCFIPQVEVLLRA
jgi:hypothetical protein